MNESDIQNELQKINGNLQESDVIAKKLDKILTEAEEQDKIIQRDLEDAEVTETAETEKISEEMQTELEKIFEE